MVRLEFSLTIIMIQVLSLSLNVLDLFHQLQKKQTILRKYVCLSVEFGAKITQPSDNQPYGELVSGDTMVINNHVI
jgi:hypothetical protein